MLRIKTGTLRYLFLGMIVLFLVLIFPLFSVDPHPQETDLNDYRWDKSESIALTKGIEVLTPNNAPGYDIVCIA